MKRLRLFDDPAQGERWKKRAKYACVGVVGVAVVAGLAVAVTLAVTQSTAQRESLIAYLHGRVDTLSAGGWLDGWAAAERHYAEHGIEELVEALAQESLV